ncbi:MAG: hypothetical protein VX473_04545 [Candidatus Thermoplasmatota archaeon]|nr:hypothetical protein [Candidatus Thermoplasmatota archaeon]
MDKNPQPDIISIPASNIAVTSGGLPPSKSHLIRWLLLASQGDVCVEINRVNGAGHDALAMRDALIQMGVEINIKEDTWTVQGVGQNGFQQPKGGLNFHNSGTALRLLTIACSQIGEWISINGDSTLNTRINRGFWESLGIDLEFPSNGENLPMKIKGPIQRNTLALDCSKTSQYLSGILLSMPSRSEELLLSIDGDIVSRRHAELSFSIAAQCGSKNQIGNNRLMPWKCEPPASVEIPPDASHVAFWKLYEILHGVSVSLPRVDENDSIGAELLDGLDLQERQTIDLGTANDLITPLAAAMAIGNGGIITGVSHARFKESNRIEKTVEMLSLFSIDVESTEDGLKIIGNQFPSSPQDVVPTFGDHRMQMTAAVLATKVGAQIEGKSLHKVSFPQFIDCIQP